MNWRAALIALGSLLVINVITAWPLMDPGFPFSLYGSREDFGRPPATAVVLNAVFAMVAAFVVGVVARWFANKESQLPIRVETHAAPDNVDHPRSDHEYLRLNALHRDGRCVPIMIGVSYGDPVYFSLRFLETDEQFSCDAPNVFFALSAARAKFEPQGWYILCNGARRDCYAFGSVLHDDLGEKVYQLMLGHPLSANRLLWIFDEADEATVSSIDEQRAFYDAWCQSLAAHNDPGLV